MRSMAAIGDIQAHVRFIGLWILTMVASTIIWMAVVTLADSYGLHIYRSYEVPISLSLWWLLAGFLQSRLLKPHMQRHRLWIFATLVGGSLWWVGLRYLSSTVRGLVLWILRSVDLEPTYALRGSITASIALVLAAGLLGFLQSFCFSMSQVGRIVWPVATALAMLLAIGICLASGNAIEQLALAMISQISVFRLPSPVVNAMPFLVRLFLGAVIFALFQAIVLRAIIVRNARRQQQVIIGQFE
jgi:hypothetical protein